MSERPNSKATVGKWTGVGLALGVALGAAFMLLCLRPAFDVVCETVALALGARGDLFHIAQATGYPTVWLGMALLFGFSLFTIVRVLVERASQDGRAAT